MIRLETELAFVFYRTHLFRPEDIDNVKKINDRQTSGEIGEVILGAKGTVG